MQVPCQPHREPSRQFSTGHHAQLAFSLHGFVPDLTRTHRAEYQHQNHSCWAPAIGFLHLVAQLHEPCPTSLLLTLRSAGRQARPRLLLRSGPWLLSGPHGHRPTTQHTNPTSHTRFTGPKPQSLYLVPYTQAPGRAVILFISHGNSVAQALAVKSASARATLRDVCQIRRYQQAQTGRHPLSSHRGFVDYIRLEYARCHFSASQMT